MTKNQCEKIINKATKVWLAKNPTFKWENLTGRNHWKGRTVVFNRGLSNAMPFEVTNSLYYTGQGQETIVPTDYAKFIAKELGVPYNFIFHPVGDV